MKIICGKICIRLCSFKFYYYWYISILVLLFLEEEEEFFRWVLAMVLMFSCFFILRSGLGICGFFFVFLFLGSIIGGVSWFLIFLFFFLMFMIFCFKLELVIWFFLLFYVFVFLWWCLYFLGIFLWWGFGCLVFFDLIIDFIFFRICVFFFW